MPTLQKLFYLSCGAAARKICADIIAGFAKAMKRISPELTDRLLKREWKGNVRELENTTRLWLRKDEKFTQYVGWAEPDTRGLLRSDKTGSAHPTTLFF